MTHKILKSIVATIPDFEKQVAAHVAELKFWHDREAIVAAEAKTPLGERPIWGKHFAGEKDPADAYSKAVAKWDAEKLKRHAPVKRPTPHPEVEASVRQYGDNYVADFEIVNDDPTDGQVLRDKKNALLIKIAHAESASADAALPLPGKRRLMNMREADIRAADAAIAKAVIAATPEADRQTLDVAAEVEKKRDPASTQHLKNQEAARAKTDSIARAAAQAMSDVEDLTTANVDSYQVPLLTVAA